MNARLPARTACLALAAATTAAGADEPFLLELGGSAAYVRYVPGALDRANHVERRFSLLAREFARHAGLGRRGIRLPVEVLDRDAWELAGYPAPYGLPARQPARMLAVPAWGDPEAVSLWRALLGGELPAVGGTPLRGTPEEAATLVVADLLAEVEGARVLLERAGYRGTGEGVEDLLAHLVALAAIDRHEPGRRGEVASFYAALDRGETPAAAAGTGLGERLERERDGFRRAWSLIETEGPRALKTLLKAARRAGGVLSAEEVARRYPPARGP